jgi:hypothetical protein
VDFTIDEPTWSLTFNFGVGLPAANTTCWATIRDPRLRRLDDGTSLPPSFPYPGVHTVTNVDNVLDPNCIYFGQGVKIGDTFSFKETTEINGWSVSIDTDGYPIIDSGGAEGTDSFLFDIDKGAGFVNPSEWTFTIGAPPSELTIDFAADYPDGTVLNAPPWELMLAMVPIPRPGEGIEATHPMRTRNGVATTGSGDTALHGSTLVQEFSEAVSATAWLDQTAIDSTGYIGLYIHASDSNKGAGMRVYRWRIEFYENNSYKGEIAQDQTQVASIGISHAGSGSNTYTFYINEAERGSLDLALTGRKVGIIGAGLDSTDCGIKVLTISANEVPAGSGSNVIGGAFRTLGAPSAPTYPDRRVTIGVPYTANLSSGWQFSDGSDFTIDALPTGLSMSTAGIITGTPTVLPEVTVSTVSHMGITSNAFTWTVVTRPPSGTLADAKFDALRDQGFTGTLSDMTLQWLQANGATSGSITDAWLEVLPGTGQRNDRWYTVLGGMGYTGSLNDREFAFWVDGGVLPGTVDVGPANLEAFLISEGWGVTRTGEDFVVRSGVHEWLFTWSEAEAGVYEQDLPAPLRNDIDDSFGR